jgi:hypothetical protein
MLLLVCVSDRSGDGQFPVVGYPGSIGPEELATGS